MSSLRTYTALGLSVLMLSACGFGREDLGLGRNPPDEYAVVEHPPLSMPPDFSLRPPRPGAAPVAAIDTSQRAKDALFPDNAAAAKGVSAGETALLSASGAAQAAPDIRALVDRESTQKTAASPHLIQRLMNGEGGSSASTTVDAKAEAERIKKALNGDKPLNKDATPVIEKGESSWLGL